ncbi:MAG: hypothetical protein ACLQSR_10330 [Limisphaerales bacterium]
MRFGVEKLVLAMACALLALSCLWAFIGFRFDLWTPADYIRYHWLCSRMKITPEFWNGKIKAGDDARKIVKIRPPQIIHQFGPWAELEWLAFDPDKKTTVPNVEIVAVAENARLVFAKSCTGDGIDERTFFNALTPAAQAQYQAALEAYTWGEFSRKTNVKNPTRRPTGTRLPHR